MKKAIVTTSIHPPTEALRRFSAMKDWTLVVAGDQQTPHDTYDALDNCFYLHPACQEAVDKTLSDMIGWRCIQRRNFATLYALEELQADLIAFVDDDNIPYDDWPDALYVNRYLNCTQYNTPLPIYDPLEATDNKELWHRGYPQHLVNFKDVDITTCDTIAKFNIQAMLWNGDPDIDAVCRLMYPHPVNIKCECSPFCSNKPSPFNSQNTILTRDAAKHFFLFPGVGRADDIMASYYVQQQGFRVCYTEPTVYSHRNKHNIYKDMSLELYMYEWSARYEEALKDLTSAEPFQRWKEILSL